ncbi:MAG TPA: hypothetical protein VNN20_14000 [Thermodesulfobacteriota bacterium]|nr:hypothetical protein [Thermodesulfobacteriota bacterium]
MSDMQSESSPWVAPQPKKTDIESRPVSEMKDGWDTLKPETLPKPTYWPAVMALGIAFLAMGLATNLLVSGVGLLLFALSLAGWIGEIIHERQK